MSTLFPIFKQVFAKTIKLDFVQVKPMNVPTGTLHYMDYNEEFERQRLLEERKDKIKKILEKSKNNEK
tara:strand:- start:502 stop:705 length:204 start_codon:yes stop_codon:yes gene_type:complete